MRIIHLSDIHFWRFTWDLRLLAGKRTIGMLGLLKGRARKFQLERLGDVIRKVQERNPDHILITGDLTTTALPEEFEAARRLLEPLLVDPARVTILPGNHDRYTRAAVRQRSFEAAFGRFLPGDGRFPWLRWLDAETAILGLDPTRAHLTASGRITGPQVEQARTLLAAERPRRLIVACHYPPAAPRGYQKELGGKPLVGADMLRAWLATIGRHLYCCGHVHAAWAFTPPGLPDELCLNAGAPLMRDRSGTRPPGFLEIQIEDRAVAVIHHAWNGTGWMAEPMANQPEFFEANVNSPASA